MLNPTSAMLRRVILACCTASVLLVVLPGEALAQTIGPTAFTHPDRILPDGTDIGTGPRPMNLTPLGISYSDCIADQTLQFSLNLSGFGGQDVQVWGSRTADCTQDTARGNPGPASCWEVGAGLTSVNLPTQMVFTFKVRVQDLVGRQDESFVNGDSPRYKRQGPDACATQLSFSGTTFTIYFLPIQNGTSATGTAYSYQLGVDMLGPPAPAGVSDQAGDTLLLVHWTPNNDVNTIGYDIFIDPIPGQEEAGPSQIVDATSESNVVLVCPDTGGQMVSDSMSETGDDGSTDATMDAAMDSGPTDAAMLGDACHSVIQGGGGGGGSQGTCTSAVLSGATSIVVDAGTIPVATDSSTSGDDSGSTTTTSGPGGIANIPTNYLVAGGGSGITVTDKSTGNYTITGLTDNVTYNVVVTAVDAFGNVGPPSPEICDYPAPVVDFWQQYKMDGGGAGGGFCALDAVGAHVGPSIAGVGIGAAALALARRRRRRRSGK